MSKRVFIIKPPGREAFFGASEFDIDAKLDELGINSHFFGELDVRVIEMDAEKFDRLPKYVKPKEPEMHYKFD
jgi:hypothetical protein